MHILLYPLLIFSVKFVESHYYVQVPYQTYGYQVGPALQQQSWPQPSQIQYPRVDLAPPIISRVASSPYHKPSPLYYQQVRVPPAVSPIPRVFPLPPRIFEIPYTNNHFQQRPEIKRPYVSEFIPAQYAPTERPYIAQTVPPPTERPYIAETVPPPTERPYIAETVPPPTERPYISETVPPPTERPYIAETVPPPTERPYIAETVPPPTEKPYVPETTTQTPIPTTHITTAPPVFTENPNNYKTEGVEQIFDEQFVGQYYYGKRGQGNTTFPLQSCFYNPSGYVCCNLMLNELIVTSYELTKLKTSECNMHRFASRLQKHAESVFGANFETIVSVDDFAQKVHFRRDLVCKAELGGKFILAYATPKDVEQDKIISPVKSETIVKDSTLLKAQILQKIQEIDGENRVIRRLVAN